MKKKIVCLTPLTADEIKSFITKNTTIVPEIGICRSFIAVLHSDGRVTITDAAKKETELFNNVIQLSSGADHILCLGSDKRVYSYGDNSFHQCDVSNWNHVIKIKASNYCSAALTENNKTLFAGTFESNTGSVQKKSIHTDTENTTAVFDLIKGLNTRYVVDDCNGKVINEYVCSACGSSYKETKPPQMCSHCRAPGQKFISYGSKNQNTRIIKGRIPVLFSAPYSVRYLRNGETKASDAYTGAIVEYLCQCYHVHGITRIFNNNDDPNSSKDVGNYRKMLENYIDTHNICVLVDLYTNSNDYPSVEIFTNNGKNLNMKYDMVKELTSHLAKICPVSVDKKNGIGRNMICNYIHRKNNLPCYKIELSQPLLGNPAILCRIINELGKTFQNRYSGRLIEKDESY